MNKYYENNGAFYSNNRIYTRTGRTAFSLAALLAMLLSLLSNKTVCGVIRALVTVGILVGFVGIIGAMDAGTLGLGAGLCIGTLLLGAEYLCLRRQG